MVCPMHTRIYNKLFDMELNGKKEGGGGNQGYF